MELTQKLKAQIEFYFSDANMRVDKYLTTEYSRNKGFPIQSLLNFNKIKSLNADIDTIKEALASSQVIKIENDKIIKIENEKTKEYRMRGDYDDYIVHVSNFPSTFTVDDLIGVIGSYCKPLLVRLRRRKDMTFAGSAFVEVDSLEDVKKLLDAKIEVDLIGDSGEADYNGSPTDKINAEKSPIDECTTDKNKAIDKKNSSNEENYLDTESDQEFGGFKLESLKNSDDGKELKRKTENGDIKKKIKKAENNAKRYLKIIRKKEYLETKKEKTKTGDKNKFENADEKKLFKNYENKTYFYKAEIEMGVKEIKDIISGLAFVDLRSKALRFKKDQEFEEKEFEKIKINKMSVEETKKYFKDVMSAKKGK